MGTNRMTCGQFGGRNSKGDPCGVSVIDGPCHRHTDAVANTSRLAQASTILDPSYEFRVAPFKRLKDKVAIVGFTNHRLQALELGDDWELWGLNELYRYIPAQRFHRWFEIHGREYLEQDEDGRKHIEDLKSVLPGVPIYMQQRHEDIPGSVKFPIDELCQQLESSYYTCCPSQMVAWAIALGYSEIHVYGVDMAQETEYGYQRPCMEYWIGRAQGMGIVTHVPTESDLLTCVGIYGYESEGGALAIMIQERIKWLHAQDNERLALLRRLEKEYREKKAEIQIDVHRLQGAQRELQFHRKSAKRDGRLAEIAEAITKQMDLGQALEAEYQGKHTQLAAERNQLVGAIGNAEYIMRAWLVKPESVEGGGNIPSVETRAADVRLGIVAPSGDGAVPTTPTAVPAQ